MLLDQGRVTFAVRDDRVNGGIERDVARRFELGFRLIESETVRDKFISIFESGHVD
jgi:hypothetical protein